MMRSVILAAALLALSPARADMPFNAEFGDPSDQKREWPDGPVKDFLKGLERPDNDKHPERITKDARSCCDAGDTVKTKFKVDGTGQHPDDQWFAWLDGKWTLIPPDKIVSEHAPDGQAYLFVMTMWSESDYGGKPSSHNIVCFVRPKGGL